MAADSLRVTVFGAGAIGGWLASRLIQRGGVRVSIVARGPQLAAIRERGLTLRSHDDGVSEGLKPHDATDDAATLGEQDVVFVTTKAHAIQPALSGLLSLLGPDTVVVPLINGIPWWLTTPDCPIRAVDPDGELLRALPRERVVGAVVYSSVAVPRPGEVQQVAHGRLVLGEPDGRDSARLHRLAALFEGSRVGVQLVPDIAAHVWTKLMGNISLNLCCALTLATMQDLLASSLRPTLAAMMHETVAVARACGAEPTMSVEKRMEISGGIGGFKPSTLQDVEAGRPTEVEALAGAVVELAGRHGVPVPTVTVVYELMKARDRQIRAATERRAS
jgi:2-dehydropantoate 2-reductase